MDHGARGRARKGGTAHPVTGAWQISQSGFVALWQIQNELLRQMCAEMQAQRASKVTVTSTAGFEGKVWE